MKNILFIILLLVTPIIGKSQDREERKVDSFNELKVGQAIKVILRQSNEEKIIIESSNVDLADIRTEVSDGTLKIYLKGERYRSINVNVDVYYRNLKGISASSAASVKSDGVIKGDNFAIDASSAASIDVKLDVYDLEVDVSSAADVRLAGKAHELEIDVSSAGGVNAYDLIAEIVDASASSAGSAKVHATKSLVARASSGGSIRYSGSPDRSNIDSSSGGSVKKSS